ncbi:EndoU domain-containing protein [Glycomyces sp. YM15]|uniref:EndoU domain-containing protein n=1 Tax=Glycomyces sp. YM15 TaxID=2800446 RepID=UPI0019668F55|nr:EndoU domain-containing protein [Glycomyces sp. YM15]
MAKKKSGGAGATPIKLAVKFLDKFKARPGRGSQMRGKELNHQQRGEIKTNRETGERYGSGYHHRPGGEDHAGRRTTEISETHPNGVYSGKVEFENGSPPPDYIPKQGDGTSAFFPDHWSAEKVDSATSNAFEGSTKNPDKGTWTGSYTDDNGKVVKIEGWYDPSTGNIGHGFPSFDQP